MSTTRAYLAMGRKQWKDADNFFTEVLRLKPSDVNSYVNRALCRIHTNNLRGVMDDYDKAIELDPNNFLAHYNRGLIRVVRVIRVRHSQSPLAFSNPLASGDFIPVKSVNISIWSLVLPRLSTFSRNALPTAGFSAPCLAK